jgi:hypothetical protein
MIVRFDPNPMASADTAALIAAYAQIGGTPSGANLISGLESSPVVYTITSEPDPLNGSRADFNQYTNTIHLDPTFHPVIAVAAPCYTEASPTNANLAHELGHAAQSIFAGVNADFDELDAIATAENPFRADIGLPARVAYPAVRAFSLPAPRPLVPPLW